MRARDLEPNTLSIRYQWRTRPQTTLKLQDGMGSNLRRPFFVSHHRFLPGSSYKLDKGTTSGPTNIMTLLRMHLRQRRQELNNTTLGTYQTRCQRRWNDATDNNAKTCAHRDTLNLWPRPGVLVREPPMNNSGQDYTKGVHTQMFS